MLLNQGIRDVAYERQKQLSRWGTDHDTEQHREGDIARRAGELLESVYGRAARDDRWGLIQRHHSTRDRLVIAAALIAAEIDRLDRADGRRLGAPALKDGWQVLSFTGTDDGRISRLMAAKCEDGIGVIGSWTLTDDEWHYWSVDTENGAEELIVDYPPFL